MLFLTATGIGFAAGMMRSAFCIALTGVLIVAAFALATLMSVGPAHYFHLLYAILGYNFGIVMLVASYALFSRHRTA
ncbi:MAG: hypothetical protein PW791_17120 [Neorhizobium sp.]|nr:hypothetical protein [Neorhizobium sp.]